MKLLNFFIVLLFLAIPQGHSQNKNKSYGAEIVLNETFKNIGKNGPVLFEFIGDTHLINYYLDLTFELKEVLKKYLIKKIQQR